MGSQRLNQSTLEGGRPSVDKVRGTAKRGAFSAERNRKISATLGVSQLSRRERWQVRQTRSTYTLPASGGTQPRVAPEPKKISSEYTITYCDAAMLEDHIPVLGASTQ